MTYREMETTPPARQWGWAVRRALLWIVRVVCLTAGIAMGAKACGAFSGCIAEAEINANRRAYEERQRTMLVGNSVPPLLARHVVASVMEGASGGGVWVRERQIAGHA